MQVSEAGGCIGEYEARDYPCEHEAKIYAGEYEALDLCVNMRPWA